MHYLTLEEENLEAFAASYPTNQAVEMLNLLRFRAEAAYPPEHASEPCSGADAYARYGRAFAPLLSASGGELIWRGRFDTMLIGPQDKHWQLIALVRYPSARAFIDLVSSPQYQAIAVHRSAALLDSRLMALVGL